MQVALWSQRAARAEGLPVVWDYHVFLVLRPLLSTQHDMGDGENSHTSSLIYDFDTTLDLPHDAQRGYLIPRLSFSLGQPHTMVTSPGRVVPYPVAERSVVF